MSQVTVQQDSDQQRLAELGYAPLTVGAVLLAVGLWWLLSARHTFKGPVRTVECDDGAGIVDETPAPA